ncbi:unnamed protein product [Adineta ricciae]|uniref:Mono(ADP-ribosyl)transferase n=1 Tax=Adineta ricciae TaxID=249248 RepID=A0A815IR16_ADIRI|nr:unnamed protein product [Adineta ricciae]CAF1578652.1 unnamed protein product [Adineta ricciae]
MVTNHSDTSEEISNLFNAPHKRIISFIREYEKLPIVSLEEATAPVASFVPEVKKMVTTVKKAVHVLSDDCTIDESASILLYTLQWKPKDKSFAVILDTALQTMNEVLLEPWYLYLKLILTALTKIPSDTSYPIVYRSIKLNLITQYPSKTIFTWWGFTKCTTAIDELNSEDVLGRNGARTLFIIDCRSSKNIQQYSFYSKADVLLPFACQFEVVGSFSSGNGLSIIHLKEVPSKYAVPRLPPIPSRILPSVQQPNATHYQIPTPKPMIPKRRLKPLIGNTMVQPKNSSPTSFNDKLKEFTRISITKPNSINLDLSRLEINDTDIKTLAATLQQNTAPVTLDLHHNLIGPQGAHYLADILKQDTTLVSINLECNTISDQGVQHLSNSLSQNRTLTVLNLRSNQIRAQGLKYLSAVLQENTTLTSLKLRSNFIGNLGARFLGNALQQNKTLTLLDLENNQIGSQGAQYLIQGLRQNNALTLLNLAGNQLGGDTRQRLMEIAQKNSSLKLVL